MDPVMHLEAWAPTILTLVGVVYLAGQVTGRIKDQEQTIKDHHEQLKDHGERLGTHDVAIAESKAWRDGYSAGNNAGKNAGKDH